MASSLPASLFLLSVVFCQFLSAAGEIRGATTYFLNFLSGRRGTRHRRPAPQNYVTITATVGENVILPCKDPDQERIVAAEWSRTDLESGSVLLYRNLQFDPINQLPSYRNRVDLLVGQIQKGDASLVLQNTTTDDSGTYECHYKDIISREEMKYGQKTSRWQTSLMLLEAEAGGGVAKVGGVSLVVVEFSAERVHLDQFWGQRSRLPV
uniref:Ig-like domain-containing protein n=1 Tax=Xiphophorus couchianus TaxID=32473 RepID=A0A3B5LZT8_9TELE